MNGGAARVSQLSPAEIYEREAERLYSMADAFAYYAVRDAFLRMARQYEVLARRATAAAGAPVTRPTGGP